MMEDNIEIQVKIEEVSKEKNQIIFKPYSSEFEKSIEHYPSKAIDITALDLNNNIQDQLFKISLQYIKETLLKEKNPKYIKNIENLNIESDIVISRQLKTEELFAPEVPKSAEPPTPINETPYVSPAVQAAKTTIESTDIFSVVN